MHGLSMGLDVEAEAIDALIDDADDAVGAPWSATCEGGRLDS